MYRWACLAVCLAGSLLAQDSEKPPLASLALVNPLAPQTIQDLHNVFLNFVECKSVTYDAPTQTFHMSGTSAQLALAEWALRQVDRPAGAALPTQPASYIFADTPKKGQPETAVRMFFFTGGKNSSDLQDFQNIFRTGADIQRVAPINSMNAILVRAVPERVALAEWAARQMDAPAEPGTMASYEFIPDVGEGPPPRNRATAVRAFFFANITTSSAMQDMQNAMRTGADIQRVFPYNSRHAILIRAEPERAALAEWLVKHLDQKPQAGRSPVSYELVEPFYPASSRTVRILYFDHLNPANLQAIQTRIRTECQIQRIFPMHDTGALVVEGRPEQIATAEKMVADADVAAAKGR